MAQRPIARTDFLTKSTSTSVAYLELKIYTLLYGKNIIKMTMDITHRAKTIKHLKFHKHNGKSFWLNLEEDF